MVQGRRGKVMGLVRWEEVVKYIPTSAEGEGNVTGEGESVCTTGLCRDL